MATLVVQGLNGGFLNFYMGIKVQIRSKQIYRMVYKFWFFEEKNYFLIQYFYRIYPISVTPGKVITP